MVDKKLQIEDSKNHNGTTPNPR